MKRKEIKVLINILNSSCNFFKYPIGNKVLLDKVKELEMMNLINYDKLTQKWGMK